MDEVLDPTGILAHALPSVGAPGPSHVGVEILIANPAIGNACNSFDFNLIYFSNSESSDSFLDRFPALSAPASASPPWLITTTIARKAPIFDSPVAARVAELVPHVTDSHRLTGFHPHYSALASALHYTGRNESFLATVSPGGGQ